MEFEKLQSIVGELDRGIPLSESRSIDLELLLGKHNVSLKGHPIDSIKSAGYDSIEKQAGRGGAEPEMLIFDPTKTRFKRKP